MTWIKTVPASEDERVRKASEEQRHLYPIEYATPVHPTLDGETAGIVDSHSLIPDALITRSRLTALYCRRICLCSVINTR